jgi:hypothetical protein
MQGYQQALEIFAQRPIRNDELDHSTMDHLTLESASGSYFLGHASPEDRQAFLFAVLALKTLTCAASDSDRSAASRLLRASASAIDRFEFAPEITINADISGHVIVAHAEHEIRIVMVRYLLGRSKSSLIDTITLDQE